MSVVFLYTGHNQKLKGNERIAAIIASENMMLTSKSNKRCARPVH